MATRFCREDRNIEDVKKQQAWAALPSQKVIAGWSGDGFHFVVTGKETG
jgi:hypothetical protein